LSLLDALLGDKGLVVRFKADLTELEAGLAKAKTDLTGWRDQTNESTKDMAKWGAAVTATVAPVVAAGTAVYALQQRYGAMADQIDDLSTTTGMSVEKIQQLQRAAILSNTDFSNVTMGVNALTLAIAKAGDTSSDAGQAFAQLGISPSGKSVDQVFEETTAALMGMEDTTRRNEIAMTLYSRSWKEMLPYMEDYIKNKEKIQSSPTFSKQDLQDLKDAKAAWDDLGNSVTIYTGKALVEVQKGTDLLMAMSPIITGNLKGFLDNASDYRMKKIKEQQDILKDLIADNAKASGTSMGSSDWASALFGGASEGKATSTVDLIDNIADAMKDYGDAVKGVTEETEKLNDINKDFTREMSVLNPRDVAAARNLNIRHKWAAEDQMGAIGKAQGEMATAAAGVGKASGDLIININDKLLARIPGVATTSGERSLMQAGH